MWFLENLIGGKNEDEIDEELDQESEDSQEESADENSDEEKKSEESETSKSADSIEKLRKDVVDAYLNKLNKKNFVKWLIRGQKIKAKAREYILEPKQEEQQIDLSWLNLPPEVSQFADVLKGSGSGFLPSILKKFTGVSVGFDEEKELNPMKELMAKEEYKTDKVRLEELKKSIKDGVDIQTLLWVGVPVVVWTGVVATNTVNTTSESSDFSDLRAERVGPSFEILTGSKDANLDNKEAKNTVESMLESCTFFWKDLKLNKYVIPKLEEVEKEIKESDIDYPINSVWEWWYHRRNVSWGSSLSYHALGLALDINPATNPFVETKWGKIPTDMPKEFLDIFRKHGFVWWGDWWKEGRKDEYKADAMHFQFADTEYLKKQMQLDNSYNMAA